MRTSKPISSIIWTTSEYAEMILNRLIENNTLAFWSFIRHKAECGEQKDHNHVYVIPGKLIDTDLLTNCFDERLPDGTVNGCSKLWTKSKFDDWFLYGLHDEDYLLDHGLERMYSYKYQDFKTSDNAMFYELSIMHPSLDIKEVAIRSAASGQPWQDFLYHYRKMIHLRDVFALREIFKSAQGDRGLVSDAPYESTDDILIKQGVKERDVAGPASLQCDEERTAI